MTPYRRNTREGRGTSVDAWHLTDDLARRYVAGDGTLDPGEVWSVEAHLEACADYRNRFAGVVTEQAPDVAGLLDRVHGELAAALPQAGQAPLRRRYRSRLRLHWFSPATLAWV